VPACCYLLSARPQMTIGEEGGTPRAAAAAVKYPSASPGWDDRLASLGILQSVAHSSSPTRSPPLLRQHSGAIVLESAGAGAGAGGIHGGECQGRRLGSSELLLRACSGPAGVLQLARC
jgi:hypothetical protein